MLLGTQILPPSPLYPTHPSCPHPPPTWRCQYHQYPSCTMYKNNIGFDTADSHVQTKAWFWSILREMGDQDRQRFLQFSTGQPVPPVGGFAAGFQVGGEVWPFTINAVSTEAFPVSHTCFASIDLPTNYSSRDVMLQRLNACLTCASFGLD